MASRWPFLLFFLFALHHSARLFASAQQDTTCSALNPCLQGCCSQYGSCGFGPDFCGDGCLNNCNATAECGQYGTTDECPLGVCCSQFGFCGTTEGFCGTGCQNGCETVKQPSCPSSRTADGLQRKIAYYELFGADRPCDVMMPEAIPAGALTHINLAFVNFDDTFHMVDEGGDLVARVSKLKLTYPGLRVNVAVGGWNFNDPPSSTYFSDMASDYDSRQTFISSVADYLTKYGLDGIDIDWEYPTAVDRGGTDADTQNYVLLLANMREAFDAINPGWEITVTLPNSYWYLQNFDLPRMQKYVSWFNVMSYDLHGMWDQGNKFTGAYLLGHTNLTQIDEGIQLLWRVGVEPDKVVLGMGFYGRSFTMTDPTCWQPWCTFDSAGNKGDCSQTPGILYYAEIASSNESINVATYYDPVSTVKVNVFNGNQWISYDDAQSWADKLAYLTGHCISGLMIWAIDQDTGQYDALSGLLGADATASGLLQGGSLSDKQKERLADEFGAYTGQDCFVTPTCTDGKTDRNNNEKYCPSGWSAVTTAHAPLQRADVYIGSACKPGEFHYICCPTSTMPKNCQWNGAPERSEIGCSGFCGDNQFQLNSDTYINATGSAGPCYQGSRALCCDSTEILQQCKWTDCQGPTDSALTCPSGYEMETFRYDNGAGQLCSVAAGAGSVGTEQKYAQAYCCPTDNKPQNCSWTFDIGNTFDSLKTCLPRACPATQVEYTTALDPPNPYKDVVGSLGGVDCSAYQQIPGQSREWPYCCDPPEDYNGKWPVDPSYLWASPDEEEGADILWAYQDNFGSNSADKNPDEDYGDDPYGFVMIDGPPGSVDGSFGDSFTVVRRTATPPPGSTTKRSLLTTNRTAIDTVFEHASEVLYVFCNYPDDSPRCQKLFYRGAEDTIIKLPDHVGEGPFARVASMTRAADDYTLPRHHLVKRAATTLDSTVWRMEIDYNFAGIKRDDGPVNLRVDFTNLLDYWEDVTDEPAKMRRDLANGQHLSYGGWRGKVANAKASHNRMRKRQADVLSGTSTTHLEARDGSLQHESARAKRWFGAFVDWLTKVTTVETSDKGYLTMFFKKSFLLYRAFVGCSRTFAKLDIYLDAEAAMDATYAYYYSGALGGVVPTATYAYLAVQPNVYLGLTVKGDARLEYQSPRIKLLPTISYPGLAVKGLAAVGPTLDVFGQIVGVIQIGGVMQVGARYTFEQSEMWWPDDGSAAPVLDDLVDPPEPVADGLTPEFQASVQASVDVDVRITPEAHLGIQIGGSGVFGKTLVDAQVVAYVNNTLRFHADASGSVSGGGSSGTSASASYNYGVYLLYNVGFGGWATIVGYTWDVKSRNLFNPPKSITLYTNGGVLTADDVLSKRDGGGGDRPLLAGHRWNRRGLTLVDLESETGVFNGAAAGLGLRTPESYGESGSETFAAQARIVGMDGDLLWTSGDELINITLPRGGGPSQLARVAKRDDTPGEGADAADDTNPGLNLGTITCPPSSCDGDDTSPSSSPSGVAGGSAVAKRAVGKAACGWVLPDFRYNCNIFVKSVAVGPSGSTGVIPGICDNVKSFLSSQGLGNSGMVLTYDSANQAPRRNRACRGSPCQQPNIVYRGQAGLTSGLIVSCDEFPFASTEEGGDYTSVVSTKCVPNWQQSIQGNCNKLLNQLSTNVTYFDGGGNPSFQSWTATNWLRNTSWQRTALYPSKIPRAYGIRRGDDIGEYGPNAAGEYMGYYHRRNFTMGLAEPAGSADGAAWGTQPAKSWGYQDPKNGNGNVGTNDVTAIACAFNTFGQSDIYRYANANAMCWTGSTSQKVGFTVPSFVYCEVQFTGGPLTSNSKRDVADDKPMIGTFNGWGVKKIVLREDLGEVVPAPDFVPNPDEMLPVEWYSEDAQ